MKIQVEGLENVESMLNTYADGIAKKLSRGIGTGCKIVEGEAKALCPVSTEETRPGGPHGELRQSITSQVDGLTADENAHTVTVSDLSDSGVHTSIRCTVKL